MDNTKTKKGVSNTNRVNRNKKTVTIGSLLEEGGKYASTKGEGSKVEASLPKLPASNGRYRRTRPGLGRNSTLKKEGRRRRRRGSFDELISLIQLGVIKPPYIFSKWSAWRRGYGFIPLNEKQPNTEAHHIDSVHVIFIDKELHRRFASLNKEEHREALSAYINKVI